jgi:hypothetical protein
MYVLFENCSARIRDTISNPKSKIVSDRIHANSSLEMSLTFRIFEAKIWGRTFGS